MNKIQIETSEEMKYLFLLQKDDQKYFQVVIFIDDAEDTQFQKMEIFMEIYSQKIVDCDLITFKEIHHHISMLKDYSLKIQSIFIILNMQNNLSWFGNSDFQNPFIQQYVKLDSKYSNLDFLHSSQSLYPFFYSNVFSQNYLPKLEKKAIGTNDIFNKDIYQQKPQKSLSDQAFQSKPIKEDVDKNLFPNQIQRKKQSFNTSYSNKAQSDQSRQEQTLRENGANKNIHKQTKIQIQNYLPQKCNFDENKLFSGKQKDIRSYKLTMLSEFSRQLIIFILDNQEVKDDFLIALKNEISQLVEHSINKNSGNFKDLLDQVTRILATKMSKFKKTKEEMIKYIFRKIFNAKNKPEEISELNWRNAQKIHRKNSEIFKSMNMKFVAKQFQNPTFVELYQIFLNKFKFNFEQQNQERIDRLNTIVMSALTTGDLNELRMYKKMPWNKKTVLNIEKVFSQLRVIQKKIIREKENHNEMKQSEKEDLSQKSNSDN